jgi:hypothetical protein
LYEFFSKTNLIDTPQSILEQKVLSLIRRFQPLHKSLLIKTLYKENLLNKNCENNNISCYLRLSGADLTGLQLGKKDEGKVKILDQNIFFISDHLRFLSIWSVQLFISSWNEFNKCFV